jgi:hypothetical protein
VKLSTKPVENFVENILLQASEGREIRAFTDLMKNWALFPSY